MINNTYLWERAKGFFVILLLFLIVVFVALIVCEMIEYFFDDCTDKEALDSAEWIISEHCNDHLISHGGKCKGCCAYYAQIGTCKYSCATPDKWNEKCKGGADNGISGKSGTS